MAWASESRDVFSFLTQVLAEFLMFCLAVIRMALFDLQVPVGSLPHTPDLMGLLALIHPCLIFFWRFFFFLFFVHLAYLSRSTDKIHLGTGKIRSWNWRWASDWQGARFPVSNISNKVNAVSLWSHTCRQAKRCTEFFKGLCFVSGVPLTAPCC